MFTSSFHISFTLNHLFLWLESYARVPYALRLDMQFTVVRQDINRALFSFCFLSYAPTGLRSCSPRSSPTRLSMTTSPTTREDPATTPLATPSSIGSSALARARRQSRYMRIIPVRRMYSRLSVCSRSLLRVMNLLTLWFFIQLCWALFKTAWSSCIWKSAGYYKFGRSHVFGFYHHHSDGLSRTFVALLLMLDVIFENYTLTYIYFILFRPFLLLSLISLLLSPFSFSLFTFENTAQLT